jgi:hypothetical protein
MVLVTTHDLHLKLYKKSKMLEFLKPTFVEPRLNGKGGISTHA